MRSAIHSSTAAPQRRDPQSEEALESFIRAFPTYSATARLDQMRAKEFERLDRLGHVYLDYTGGGLYPASLVRRHQELLLNGVLGNPHSHSPASLAASVLVDDARRSVLEFFNADPGEYDVIFSPNASGALRIVGESYPFESGGRLLLTYDNHNSVNGLREFARARGAGVSYVPVLAPELRVDPSNVLRELRRSTPGRGRLFAFPAQSNFSGVQHPLSWIDSAHDRGWDVILDAAAFVPTNRLDLSRVKPDFVPLSFYKMFGYPTGIGALLCRRSALTRLHRPWFAGGTITVASVQGAGWHHLAPGHTGFEDGTVDYLGLPAVKFGLERLAQVGVEVVHDRVMALTAWLLGALQSTTHANGVPIVRLYGPANAKSRGATMAFDLVAPDRTPYDVPAVEGRAGQRGISIRTGCFCNPGDGEVAHGITRSDMASCFDDRTPPLSFEECSARLREATGKTPNTMRISFGWASNFADAWAFLQFVRSFRDVPPDGIREVPDITPGPRLHRLHRAARS